MNRLRVFLPNDGAGSSERSVVNQTARSSPHYALRFAAIDEPAPIEELTALTATGAMPSRGSPDWVQSLAGWDTSVILRFGHEMNGDHYPWSIGMNGNSAAKLRGGVNTSAHG